MRTPQLKQFRFNYFLLLGLLGFPMVAAASAERTFWLYEQMSEGPAPTLREQTRFQLGASTINYADTFSGQAQVNFDLSYAEVSLYGSQRLFLNGTEAGVSTAAQLDQKTTTLGIEVARFFSTLDNRYGRLGFAYFHLLPGNVLWFRIGLDSGVLPTARLPWSLRLRPALYLNPSGLGSILVVGAEIQRLVDKSHGWQIQIGGLVDWSYATRADTAVNNYQYMLFSIGPLAQADTALGAFRLAARWRVWLDREVFLDMQGKVQTGNPCEFSGIPDANLSWNVLF